MPCWLRGKCIGKGAFGTVSVAVAKSDGRVFAVKSVDRRIGQPGQLHALENEIRILSCMSSPYVVAFLGDDATCEGGAATPYRNLHLEYLPGGTVADLDADADECLVRHYTWCLVNALRHVHSRGVVHCDVKGRNVLVGTNGSVAKLADFGSAVEFSGDECVAATAGGGILPRGSPLWMAPEVIRLEYQGPESDVWSLGCTVIEMITGKPAWEDHGVDTLSRIGYSGELPEFPSQMSGLGRDFLEKCLRKEPKQRWSCDQLLQHPFLLAGSSTNNSNLVESSPKCVLEWANSDFVLEEEEEEEEEEIRVEVDSEENSAKERIGKLATGLRANWEGEDWVAVRALALESDAETVATVAGDRHDGGCGDEEGEGEGEAGKGTGWEYSVMMKAKEEIEVGKRITAGCERVYPEFWNLCGRTWLEWRCEESEWSEWHRRESVAGWSCQYGVGCGKQDGIEFEGTASIYSLCCKLFRSRYLFSIYFNVGYVFSWIVIYIACSFWACDNNVFFILGVKNRKIYFLFF